MATYTTREARKAQEAIQLAGSLSNSDNSTLEIQRIHTRSRDCAKVGTENAATNVAETVMFTVNRKSKPTVKYLTGTNSAQDASNYLVFTISKKTAGASKTTVATYNTHNSAQGSIVKDIPASFSVVANSDSTIAAGDALFYEITKVGTGVALAIGTITVDLEEV